jgi:hypothetical protein
MWAVRFTVSVLTLVALSNAQDSCVVRGLVESQIADGIRVARGSIAFDSVTSNALLFQPISTNDPTPPILCFRIQTSKLLTLEQTCDPLQFD